MLSKLNLAHCNSLGGKKERKFHLVASITCFKIRQRIATELLQFKKIYSPTKCPQIFQHPQPNRQQMLHGSPIIVPLWDSLVKPSNTQINNCQRANTELPPSSRNLHSRAFICPLSKCLPVPSTFCTSQTCALHAWILKARRQIKHSGGLLGDGHSVPLQWAWSPPTVSSRSFKTICWGSVITPSKGTRDEGTLNSRSWTFCSNEVCWGPSSQ